MLPMCNSLDDLVRGLAAHETTWIPARTRGLDGLDSLQPPITLKQRPKGAKTTAGLVPATSARFQTVQTQLGFQPELLVFQTIFNSMPLSIPG